MNWLQEMLRPARETEGNGNFRAGDDVVVAQGPFQCTPGVFVKLTDDVNWAEIKEYNGIVRSHPVIWLRHSRAFHAAVKGREISAMTAKAA
jgi:hypothetical protein